MEYLAGVPCQVTIQVLAGNNDRVYAVEDQPPAGWVVSRISDNGAFDAANRKVKWGPFHGDYGRAISYWATPSSPVTGKERFAGIVAFNGGNIPIDRQFQFALPLLSVRRYSPLEGTDLELSSSIGRIYQIQSSADLTVWKSILDITNYDGTVQFTDTNATNSARQFYRAYAP
jgi:hypothetical protein